MPHKCTVVSPLPTGVVGLTVPSPWGAPGMPVIAGQVLVLDDAAFAQIPQFWFGTSNSFGVALITDNGELDPGVPPPTASAVVPATAPHATPTAVVVTGTFLTGATAVLFNGVPGTSFSVVNSYTIDVTTPVAAAAGACVVQVVTPGGYASLSPGFSFT